MVKRHDERNGSGGTGLHTHIMVYIIIEKGKFLHDSLRYFTNDGNITEINVNL